MPAKTEKQANFMRAVAHGWKPKGRKAPSPSVARHFMHVKEQAPTKRFGGREDRLRSIGAQLGTTAGKDVARRTGFVGTQSKDEARRGGFQGTQRLDVARKEGRFGKMNPDKDRAFTQRTSRPSTPTLSRRSGELRLAANKEHGGSPLRDNKMNNFIHNPYQITPETMVNKSWRSTVLEDSEVEAAEVESKTKQAALDRARSRLKRSREAAKSATKRLLSLQAQSSRTGHVRPPERLAANQEYEGELQNEVTKKRKKAQEELEQAAKENKPTNRKIRRMFRKSGKQRQLDITTTHGGRMPGESYNKN